MLRCGKRQERIHICKLKIYKPKGHREIVGVVAYVEQARVARVGLGGLHGEARSVLGEQELPAASRISSKNAENGEVVGSRRKLLLPRSHYQRRLPGPRSGLLVKNGVLELNRSPGEADPTYSERSYFPKRGPILRFLRSVQRKSEC
jgi:hypothetical protein